MSERITKQCPARYDVTLMVLPQYQRNPNDAGTKDSDLWSFAGANRKEEELSCTLREPHEKCLKTVLLYLLIKVWNAVNPGLHHLLSHKHGVHHCHRQKLIM